MIILHATTLPLDRKNILWDNFLKSISYSIRKFNICELHVLWDSNLIKYSLNTKISKFYINYSLNFFYNSHVTNLSYYPNPLLFL